MNQLFNSDATIMGIVNGIESMQIGDQITISNGDMFYGVLSSLPVWLENLYTPNKENTFREDFIKANMDTGKLVGWEIGKVNKTTPTVTQYNLIGMLLDSGEMVIYRPRRNGVCLRNGTAGEQHIKRDYVKLSTGSIKALSTMFTSNNTSPKADNLTINTGVVNVPINVRHTFNIVMSSEISLNKLNAVADVNISGILQTYP